MAASIGKTAGQISAGADASITLGSATILMPEAEQRLRAYAVRHGATLRWYDYGGHPEAGVRPSDGITIEDIGRLALIDGDLTGTDAAALLGKVAAEVDWSVVGPEERFEDSVYGGDLQLRMRDLWSQLRWPNIAHAKISKLLHMKRPHTFPILDKQVRNIYWDRAREVGAEYPMPPGQHVQRLYNEAIRQDVVASSDALEQLRARFAGEPDPVGWLAGLTTVRIFDILAWRPA